MYFIQYIIIHTVVNRAILGEPEVGGEAQT